MGVLKTIAAAATFALSAYMATHAAHAKDPCKGHKSCRPLTSGERGLAQKFFGESIPSATRISFQPPHPTAKAGVRSDGIIYVYGAAFYSRDYSRDTGRLKGLFMHEVHHILELKRGNLRPYSPFSSRRGEYNYILSDRTRFASLGSEQQGMAIEHYFNLRADLLRFGVNLKKAGYQYDTRTGCRTLDTLSLMLIPHYQLLSSPPACRHYTS